MSKMKVLKCVRIFIMTLIGTFFSLSLVPIILPIFTFFYLISLFSLFVIKIKYGKRARKATGPDVLFGKETNISRTIINVALRFSGKMDHDKIRSRFENMIMNSVDADGRKRYRRMTQIYCKAFGYNIWKDAEVFNINQHIKEIKLQDLVKLSLDKELSKEEGANNEYYIEELMKLQECKSNFDWKLLMKCMMNEIGTKKFSTDLPQWQLFLVNENDEKYTALFRFHHAIADGVYITRMLCEGFLDSPADLFHSYVAPSRLKMFLFSLWSFSLIPFGIWKIMKNKDKNVLHGPKLSGKKRFFLSNPIELETLRTIRERTRVGTLGIMFSCLSNALASHFKRRSTTVRDVTTLIPVPLQNLQKPIKLKNKFAILSLKVPTPPTFNSSQKSSIGCSSLERLQMIKRVLVDAKRDPTFIAVHSLITAFCSFLPTSVAEYLLSTKGCSVAFSNMPGPQTEISFGDDRIEDIMFWNPDRDPLGTGLSVLSYNGKFRVGLCIDEALLKDETEGDFFLQGFEGEVKNILQELDNLQSPTVGRLCEKSKFLKSAP